MSDTSEPQPGSAYARTNPKYWIGVEAEDIPQGWMDDMAKRLFDAMNRNLIRLETAQARVNDQDKTSQQIIDEATRHQRLASQIRADMERMRKLEMKKQRRKPKSTINDDEERAELQREIDRIIAASNAANVDPKPAG
jgi:hypothetical protein